MFWDGLGRKCCIRLGKVHCIVTADIGDQAGHSRPGLLSWSFLALKVGSKLLATQKPKKDKIARKKSLLYFASWQQRGSADARPKIDWAPHLHPLTISGSGQELL